MSDMAAGAFFGLRGAVSHAYGTLLGPAVDKTGLRYALIAGFALSCVGRATFALAETITLAGVTAEGLQPPALRLPARLPPQRPI